MSALESDPRPAGSYRAVPLTTLPESQVSGRFVSDDTVVILAKLGMEGIYQPADLDEKLAVAASEIYTLKPAVDATENDRFEFIDDMYRRVSSRFARGGSRRGREYGRTALSATALIAISEDPELPDVALAETIADYLDHLGKPRDRVAATEVRDLAARPQIWNRLFYGPMNVMKDITTL